jgi:hypothetical protein
VPECDQETKHGNHSKGSTDGGVVGTSSNPNWNRLPNNVERFEPVGHLRDGDQAKDRQGHRNLLLLIASVAYGLTTCCEERHTIFLAVLSQRFLSYRICKGEVVFG